MLNNLLASNPNEISGDQAFELYDTYGFPVELTQEIAEENSLQVDLKGFQLAMDQQRQRAKAAVTTIDLTLQDAIDKVVGELGETTFEGYQNLAQSSEVQAIVINGISSNKCTVGDKVDLVLDSTTFYGESGGQIGDKGTISTLSSDNFSCLIEIDAVRRVKGAFVHSGLVKSGTLHLGDVVQLSVDSFCRRCVRSNHTATHLLQAALKKIVDSDISQAGSLVGFDRLRFDFHSSRPIEVEELMQIEQLINSWISEEHALFVSEMSINDAKSAGAVAMFGEKYGEIVRVVDIPGVSMELCAGTHVSNTSEIGLFKIVSETGIAAGIRRIEAITGQGVLSYLNDRDSVVKTLGDHFKAQSNEIVDRVIALQSEVKSLTKLLEKSQVEVASAKASLLLANAISLGKSQYIIERLDGVPGEALQSAAQTLVDKLGVNAAVVLAGIPEMNNGKKVILVTAFGSEIIDKGLHAGKFLAPIAKLCGGGGGGRPNLAQAGGKDPEALDSALGFARDQLIKALD